MKLKGNTPWIIISVIIVVLLAGFVLYDRSATVHSSVNQIFGIKDNFFGKTVVGLTIVTDKDFENPPYSLDEQLAVFKKETKKDIEFKIREIDIKSGEGEKIIKDFNLVSYPVFVFDKKILETELYELFKQHLLNVEDKYVLRIQPYDFLVYPKPDDAPLKGNPTAPITIIEYSSLSCSACAGMKDTLYQAIEEYPGQIQLLFKHFDRTGPNGPDLILANATECAAEESKFWQMHDLLFDTQKEMLSSSDLTVYLDGKAAELELDAEKFKACMSELRYRDKVIKNTTEGYTYGVDATPTYVINNKFYRGGMPLESLKSIIEENLN